MAPQLPRNANPPVFTYETGAAYLHMTARQLQDATRAGRVTHVKLGQYTRFRQTDLDEYIERSTVRANA